MIKRVLHHIEYLTETIGPRGSATPAEREGHEYCKRTFEEMGLKTAMETFPNHRSMYRPYILAMALMLLAEGIFWVWPGVGTLVATVLAGVVSTFIVMELVAAGATPLRRLLPGGFSQNVYAVAPAKGEAHQKIVLVSHVDSHRTPWIWKTPGTFKIYRLLSNLGMGALFAICPLFLVGLFWYTKTLLWISLLPAALVFCIFLIVIQAEFTPYTKGANDNASGVAYSLALAERLKQAPLAQTEVWLLVVGCEEIGALGSAAFVERHKKELKGAIFLVVDGIGARGSVPYYLLSEGILFASRYSPKMLQIAEAVATAHPELNVQKLAMQGAFTDAYPALRAGMDCLTVVNYDRSGWIPGWHHPSDTIEQIDPQVLANADVFLTEIIQRIDRAASA